MQNITTFIGYNFILLATSITWHQVNIPTMRHICWDRHCLWLVFEHLFSALNTHYRVIVKHFHRRYGHLILWLRLYKAKLAHNIPTLLLFLLRDCLFGRVWLRWRLLWWSKCCLADFGPWGLTDARRSFSARQLLILFSRRFLLPFASLFLHIFYL